jgi:hypothetical protein
VNTDRAVLGALFLLAVVIASNLIMYGIARGAGRGDSRWLHNLLKNPGRSLEHKDAAVDELHRRVQQLAHAKKDKMRK